MTFLRKKAFSSRVIASKTLSKKDRKDAAVLIAEETDNGRDIIRTMVSILMDKVEGNTVAARVSAAQWLGNYLFGKPVETTVQLSMSRETTSLPNLTDEQLEEVLRGGLAQGVRWGATVCASGNSDVGALGQPDSGTLAVPELSPGGLQPSGLGGDEGAPVAVEMEAGPYDGETAPDSDDGREGD